MKLLVLVCILLQIFDGIFTGMGVTYLPLGLDAEANPILKYSMQTAGVATTLVLTKSFCIAVLLYMSKFRQLFVALFFVCGLYSVAALFWIYTLINHCLT